VFDGVDEISLLGVKADSEAFVEVREVFESRFDTFSNALVVFWKNPIFWADFGLLSKFACLLLFHLVCELIFWSRFLVLVIGLPDCFDKVQNYPAVVFFNNAPKTGESHVVIYFY